MAEHTCAQCGRQYDRDEDAKGQKRSWCGPCRTAYNKRYMLEHGWKYGQAPVTQRTCCDCGDVFAKWDNVWRSRCRQCYHKHRYRLDERKPPRAPGRRPGNNRWKAIRASVIAEESHCGICGEIVDKTLSGNNTKGPCVDHILPLEFGGDYYDRSNLRLAHFGCNSREGQKQLRQRYREAVEHVMRLELRIAELEGRLFLVG